MKPFWWLFQKITSLNIFLCFSSMIFHGRFLSVCLSCLSTGNVLIRYSHIVTAGVALGRTPACSIHTPPLWSTWMVVRRLDYKAVLSVTDIHPAFLSPFNLKVIISLIFRSLALGHLDITSTGAFVSPDLKFTFLGGLSSEFSSVS